MNSPIIGSLFQNTASITHGFGLRGVALETYLDALGASNALSFTTNQIHGKCIHILVDKSHNAILEGDAFITDTPSVVCFVRTADCVPILIADVKRTAIAAVHAGWRGTAEDIVGETLHAMVREFGTDPSDCLASIGPHICGECYEVGGEVIDALKQLDIGNSWQASKNYISLGEANSLLLTRAGIPSSNISFTGQCTYSNTHFASWRRDRLENERQFNFIMICEEKKQGKIF